MELDKTKLVRVKRRFLDEIGKVYKYEGKYIRIVKKSKTRYVKKLFESGLIQELEEKGYLWPCELLEDTVNDHLILISEEIRPAQNYSTWTFQMHKSVGELILDVNQICYKYGYELLDAHQGNVMWDACIPKYIDVGSIIKKRNSGNWVARREFMQAIYHLLCIWQAGYPNIAMALISTPACRNDDEIRKLYEVLCEHKENFVEEYENSYPHSEEEILRDMQNIKEHISKMSYADGKFWTNYQDAMWEAKPSKRFMQEIDFINDHSTEIFDMLELGSNQGYFAYLVAKKTKVNRIIASDYDHDAIEKMFTKFKEDEVTKHKVYPLVLDFVGVEWSELGFYKSDIVVANALTHHLIFTSKVPLDCIVDELAELTRKYLIVEFMPRGMASASRIPEWYSLEWFLDGINQRFHVIKVENIEFGRVQIYAELK